MYRHLQIGGVGIAGDEQAGNLPGEQGQHSRGSQGQDDGGGVAPQLNGLDPLDVSRAPVKAHRGLEGIAHAVQQGVDKAVHGHQNAVDGHGVLPAKGQQHHVHNDGGDAPGNVVQKAGQPAGDNLPQGLGVEPRPHKPQLHLSEKEGDKGSYGSEGHAQAAAQGRAPDADFQHAHKQQLEAHAGHRHEDVQKHAAADFPADA